MKTKTNNNVKATIAVNHNETLVRDDTKARDLKVKIPIKAGRDGQNPTDKKPVTNR